jgi:hypothetical protein
MSKVTFVTNTRRFLNTFFYLHNMGQHTLEKNHTSVTPVGKLLAQVQTSPIITEFILDRDLTNVVNVAKPLSSL